MRKFLLWTGIVVAGIAAILLGINAYFVRRNGARLESRLAELLAAGDPIALKDLARPPIPPETNAATFLRRAQNDLEAIQKELSAIFPESGLPAGPLQPAEQEKLQKLFDAYPNLMPLLEQAAACPDYDPQLDYTIPAQAFLGRRLDALQKHRIAARVLRARASLLLASGRADDALAAIVLLLKLCRHFDGEPMIIGGLVAIACRGVAVEGANVVLQSGPVGKEAREALERELDRYDAVQLHIRMLKTERALGLDMFRAMPWATSWLGRAFNDAGQLSYLDAIREYEQATSRPYYDVKPFEPVARNRTLFTPPHVALIELLRPALDAARTAMETSRATVRCLRVLNAIQQKADPDGKEPPKLSDLGLPPEVTTDPFDGQPLRVKRLPQGWLIYSVGPNRIDDGGVLDNKTDVGLAPPGYDRKGGKT